MRLAAVVGGLIAFVLCASPAPGAASPVPGGVTPMLFVVDISGSMADDDGTGRIKIDAAKAALNRILSVEGIEPGTPIGLRVYPDQSGGDCNPGKLRFDIRPRDPGEMSAFVRSLRPDGDTPTAEALRAAAADLQREAGGEGTLVLVSDGESTCDSPCGVASEIAAAGIDRTVVIAFNISEQGERELRCIADATAGTYVDASDGDALVQVFQDLSRPELSIRLDYPRDVLGDIGSDPAGLVQVDATFTNTSQQEAMDVVARIRLDEPGIGILRPVLHLGNLAPGAARSVTWEFRPGIALAGETIGFTVFARAANSLSDTDAHGSVAVADASNPSHAGPILRDRRRIAILGDSYSSGEGAGAYLPGTDTQKNACHRSALTYLVPAFDLPDSSVLACSGAVANDVFFDNDANGVPAQAEALDALLRQGDVDAVVLTLGGNDAGFGEIVVSCLFGLRDCSRYIFPSWPSPHHWVATGEYKLDHLSSLEDSLVTAYATIDEVLNTRAAVARRGSVAPILVLAYPVPVPMTPRRCPPMADGFSSGELDFLWTFGSTLNGIVEEATLEARGRGVPVFFVSDTEAAFQPNHTVCDGEPYARALNSFRAAGLDLLNFRPWSAGKAEWSLLNRSVQQLAHPNEQGYKAMTRAILRWSLGAEGVEAAEMLKNTDWQSPRPPPGPWSTTLDLGRLDDGVIANLDRGTTYPLTVGGFLPGAPVEITIRSALRVLARVEADENGRVATRIGIPPDFEAGLHTIVVAGAGPDQQARMIEISVRVRDDGWPRGVQAIALGAAGAGALALLAWLAVAVRSLRHRRATGQEWRGR